jgi:unsaturated rhamnogalacturonyl hydrolase
MDMRLVLSFIVMTLAFSSLSSQKLPKKKMMMKAIVLANDYFMKKWPNVGDSIPSADRTRPSNIWTRGVYYEGLVELYKLNPKPSYLNYMTSWAEFHNWGLRNGNKTRNGDDQCCGQTYIELYEMNKDPKRLHNIKACIDNMVSSDKVDDWSWIDAIQMAMPVFTRLGVIYKDQKYFDKMYQLYDYTKTKHGDNGLYNTSTGLWWRDKDFDPPYTTPNGKECYWSRGDGWVVAALVRTLQWLPKDEVHRKIYERDYLALMKALVPLQRKDGYWNVSLVDENDFGGKELTGTALFVYGMAWGINNGYLDKKTYKPIISKAMTAMIKECVHPNGFLGYVQGTGKQPSDSQPVVYDKMPNFEDFGLGCFILAGSEVYRMVND